MKKIIIVGHGDLSDVITELSKMVSLSNITVTTEEADQVVAAELKQKQGLPISEYDKRLLKNKKSS